MVRHQVLNHGSTPPLYTTFANRFRETSVSLPCLMLLLRKLQFSYFSAQSIFLSNMNSVSSEPVSKLRTEGDGWREGEGGGVGGGRRQGQAGGTDPRRHQRLDSRASPQARRAPAGLQGGLPAGAPSSRRRRPPSHQAPTSGKSFHSRLTP